MPRIIPLDDLTEKDRQEIREAAKAAVVARMMKSGIIKHPSEAVVRDLVPGTETAADQTDFVDLTWETAQAAGLQFWAQDSGDITAADLSGMLTASQKVPTGKVVAVFGFKDLTPTPDLTAIEFKRGAEALDFWEVEQCYGGQENGGMSRGIIVWDSQDPIQWNMAFKAAADRFVVLLSYIGERVGEHISTSS